MLIENPNLTLIHQGKVRDSYDILGQPDMRLIVATDRVSAFDVIMGEAVLSKGKVLAAMTVEWIKLLEKAGILVPWTQEHAGRGCYHHLFSSELETIKHFGFTEAELQYLGGRFMQVRKAEHVLPIEFVVRGYLEGSGWKSYQKDGTVCGHHLSPGLVRCSQLPRTLFTPSTKADPPFHDENIDYRGMIDVLAEFFRLKGIKLDAEMMAQRLASLSVGIYDTAAMFALRRDVIIADTKFEFGLVKRDDHWHLMLVDEVLTPDSSRFWDKRTYVPGQAQASFDKQPLRDWLQALCDEDKWNKQPPPPTVDPTVLDALILRYWDIEHRLFP
jgi:phosphoribosylaminoimidazole-succinocarboxamide synthase